MGIYLTFRQDMKLWGLWIGLTIALLFTSVIGGLIVLWADWDHEVKKVMDRLESERSAGNDDESAERA
jgi:MATE family multidrug resistance protein